LRAVDRRTPPVFGLIILFFNKLFYYFMILFYIYL
jgi:hypothetical protein